MKVSLIIPYIVENDLQEQILQKCIFEAGINKAQDDTEIILIDNGSSRDVFDYEEVITVHNEKNIGVLPSFPLGFRYATGDVIAYIHSDVLLLQDGWDKTISDAFETDPNLGLAGLFGASALHPDGNREDCWSNMRGTYWGKCPCHDIVGYHHGNVSDSTVPVSMFDGVGLFFRRECMADLLKETDSFASWRAPHHFYDRILSLKVLDLGWHAAMLGIDFDHWSGATASHSEIYAESAREWLKNNGHELPEGMAPDQMIYNIAEQQFFEEYSNRLPVRAYDNYEYRWGN